MTLKTEDGTTTCRARDSYSIGSGVPYTESVGNDGVRFLVGRR